MALSYPSSTSATAHLWQRKALARVVVAEDDHVLRELLMAKLLDDGYEVYGASSAHELLRLLADAGCTIPPVDGADLIVVDHYLPDLSGLDIIRRMRAARSRIPFLLMTSRPTKELLSETKRLRVPLLVKPFSVYDLSNAALLLLLTSVSSHDDRQPVAVL